MSLDFTSGNTIMLARETRTFIVHTDRATGATLGVCDSLCTNIFLAAEYVNVSSLLTGLQRPVSVKVRRLAVGPDRRLKAGEDKAQGQVEEDGRTSVA